MKVRHKIHGTVVEVPDDLKTWTPDRVPHDPALAAKGKTQPTPWWQWAQWEEVDDKTPLTPPPAKAADAKPAAAAADPKTK